MQYTVNKLAKLSGVSTRTLRILTKVNGDSTDRERDKNHDDAGSIFYS